MGVFGIPLFIKIPNFGTNLGQSPLFGIYTVMNMKLFEFCQTSHFLRLYFFELPELQALLDVCFSHSRLVTLCHFLCCGIFRLARKPVEETQCISCHEKVCQCWPDECDRICDNIFGGLFFWSKLVNKQSEVGESWKEVLTKNGFLLICSGS